MIYDHVPQAHKGRFGDVGNGAPSDGRGLRRTEDEGEERMAGGEPAARSKRDEGRRGGGHGLVRNRQTTTQTVTQLGLT